MTVSLRKQTPDDWLLAYYDSGAARQKGGVHQVGAPMFSFRSDPHDNSDVVECHCGDYVLSDIYRWRPDEEAA